MKPPAFQFYADDFLAGVADMTQTEVGAYILLLCHQWSRGFIPTDAERAALIAKGTVGEHVLAKFPCGKNVRLEAEREKQEAYRAKQAEAGRMGMHKRWHGEGAITPLKQPYNGAITEGITKNNSPSPSPSPVPNTSTSTKVHSMGVNPSAPAPSATEWADYASSIGWTGADVSSAFDYYEANGWKQGGGNKIKSWQAAARNCKRRGEAKAPAYGRSGEDVAKALGYTY